MQATLYKNYTKSSITPDYLARQQQAITDLLDAGLCAIPCSFKTPGFIKPDGEIVNITWKKYLDYHPTSHTIQNLCQDGRTYHAGVILGGHSIVERDTKLYAPACIDIDSKTALRHFEEAVSRAGLRNIYQRCLFEHTKRGSHIAALTPVLWGSTPLARYKDNDGKTKNLIELKSRFLRISPSQGYTLVRGTWANLPILTVEEWEALCQVGQNLCQLGKTAHPLKKTAITLPRYLKRKQPSKVFRSHTHTQDLNTLDDSPKQRILLRLHAPENQASLLTAVRLSPTLQDGESCLCPVHPEKSASALFHTPKGKDGTLGCWCFHEDRFFTITEIFYRQQAPHGHLTEGHTKRLPGASFVAWTGLLLDAAGIAVAPEHEVPDLPTTLSSAARQLLDGLLRVAKARAFTRELYSAFPLGWRFYCDLLSWTRHKFEQAKKELLDLAPHCLSFVEKFTTRLGNASPQLKLFKLSLRIKDTLKDALQQSLEAAQALAARLPLMFEPTLLTATEACPSCGSFPEKWHLGVTGYRCSECQAIDTRDRPTRVAPGGGAICLP